jgi:hypothetical protein
MQVDALIATSAVFIGLLQMYDTLLHIDDVKRPVRYLLMGISANLLWLTYQYRKGANYSAAYSAVALVFQLHLLNHELTRTEDEK